MKARPILFSAPMIRALLAGTKTQTRRTVKPQPVPVHDGTSLEAVMASQLANVPTLCPYGAPGDLLWCRETWQYAPSKYCHCPQPSEPSPCDDWSNGTGCASRRGDPIYAADGAKTSRWRPSIFMPRTFSRITLRITEVSVQRLQKISEADAQAEGVDEPALSDRSRERFRNMKPWPELYRPMYSLLWDEINGAGSWAANPWVWALTFEVLQKNVDEVLR